MNKRLIYLILLFLVPLVTIAQSSRQKIDSIEVVLKDSNLTITKRADLMYNLGLLLQNVDYRKSFKVGENLLAFAQKHHFTKGKIQGLLLIGTYYSFEGKELLSVRHFNDALRMSLQLKNDTLLSECYYALFYLHYQNKQYNLAKDVLEKKLDIDKKFKDPLIKAKNYDLMGLLFEVEKNYDSAKYYFQKAFEYAKIANDTAHFSTYFNNIGLIYSALNQPLKAIEIYKKVVKYKTLIQDNLTLGYSNILIGDEFLKLNKPDSAIYYANIGINQVNSNNLVLLDAYRVLWGAYKAKKDYKQSLEYFEKYLALNDSINGQTKTNAIADIQYSLEFEKKNNELKIKDIEIKTRERELTIVSILVLITLIFIYFTVLQLKKIRRLNHELQLQKQQLYEKNQEIESQNEEISAINQHQEEIIEKRTQQLKDSETLLKLSQKLAKLGSWVLNVQDHKMVLSEESFSIFGLSSSKSISLEDILKDVLVEYKPTLKYNFEQALSNSIPFEMEYARNTLDGNIKYLHIIGVPILNEKDNTIKEIVGCIQDITDRKLGELKLLEQTQALIETNKKAAEYKLMALRSVMNPHFLFNSLNSIQYFISKNIREKALDYLSQFSKLIRSVLNSSINNTITLAEEIETLRLYTNLESIRFDNFTTVIEVDDNVEISNIEIPSLLLQPYVENAILHGLSQKKEGHGLLNIRFTTDYEKLYITIEDNGIGRKEAQKLKEDQNKLHKSVGMLVTAERLEMINQDDLLAVKIEDKVDENGNSAGTKVHITLNIY